MKGEPKNEAVLSELKRLDEMTAAPKLSSKKPLTVPSQKLVKLFTFWIKCTLILLQGRCFKLFSPSEARSNRNCRRRPTTRASSSLSEWPARRGSSYSDLFSDFFIETNGGDRIAFAGEEGLKATCSCWWWWHIPCVRRKQDVLREFSRDCNERSSFLS